MITLDRPTGTTEMGTVLVVDDDPVIQSLLEISLVHEGYRVVGVLAGGDACEAVRGVDAVLLDLGLPDVPGLDVLARILQCPCPPPVIVLTGSSDTEPDACLSRGAHDFLRKPAATDELLARVGAAVRVKRLLDGLRTNNESLERLALQDALTGLANRRCGEAELERMVASAHRHERSLCVLACDVDSFKLINDNHGHPIGDRCLSELARCLVEQIRTSDVAVRWGGEEFAIFLPDLAPEDAPIVAERIRRAVADEPVPVGEGRCLPVTVSIGWTALRPGDGSQELVGRAAAALYEAKRSGRNAVVGDDDLTRVA